MSPLPPNPLPLSDLTTLIEELNLCGADPRTARDAGLATHMALSCSSLRMRAFFLFTSSNHSFINWASSSVPAVVNYKHACHCTVWMPTHPGRGISTNSCPPSHILMVPCPRPLQQPTHKTNPKTHHKHK